MSNYFWRFFLIYPRLSQRLLYWTNVYGHCFIHRDGALCVSLQFFVSNFVIRYKNMTHFISNFVHIVLPTFM